MSVRGAMGIASVLAASALVLAGCTPSAPSYTRARHVPSLESQISTVFSRLAADSSAEEVARRGPIECGTTACQQPVTNGTLWWSREKGALPVLGPIGAEWIRTGGARGALGTPQSGPECANGVCHQVFRGGTITEAGGTATVVGRQIATAWQDAGAEAGPWGLPSGPAAIGSDGVRTQPFVGGLALAVGDAVHFLPSGAAEYWNSLGGRTGALGLPAQAAECGDIGCRQQFAGGWVAWSDTGGTHRVLPALAEGWEAAGGMTGTWGAPASEPACTPSSLTCRQTFAGGTVTWRADVGILDCRVQACVALTFDDGPGPETPRLLDILDSAGVQASFFVLGGSIPGNEASVQHAHNLFNDVGAHSVTHTELTRLSAEGQAAEWGTSASLVQATVGVQPRYGRPPYGSHNADTDATASAAGLELVYWDVDSLDWKYRDPVGVVERVMADVQAGDVILLHDIHPTTVDAVAPLIEQLRARGLVPVSMSELQGIGLPG